MGGNGTFALGISAQYSYRTVGKILDVKVLAGKNGLHNLPQESHLSQAYIQLYKDNNFQHMRLYGPDHRVKMELDYHPEKSIDPFPGKQRVFHYHLFDANGNRGPAILGNRELYEKWKNYLRGVRFREELFN